MVDAQNGLEIIRFVKSMDGLFEIQEAELLDATLKLFHGEVKIPESELRDDPKYHLNIYPQSPYPFIFQNLYTVLEDHKQIHKFNIDGKMYYEALPKGKVTLSHMNTDSYMSKLFDAIYSANINQLVKSQRQCEQYLKIKEREEEIQRRLAENGGD